MTTASTTAARAMTGDPSYTRSAVKAMARAVEAEHDFAGWLADVLARVAADQGQLGRADGGPTRSWEAAWSTSSSRARSATTTSTCRNGHHGDR